MKAFLLTTKVTILGILLNGLAFSQQNDTQILSRTWKLNKVSISGMIIQLNQEQEGDFLQLNENTTFTRIDDGIVYTGTWEWDSKTERIKLMYKQSKEEVFFKVKKVKENQLILKIEEDWKNEMVMYLSAEEFPCNI